MLFSPGSNVALFLAFGLLILGVIACLGPGLAPLAEEGIPWALLVMAAVALPAALNLWRYQRAPLGCAVIPLSFLLGGVAVWLSRSPWEQALALALPNVLFLGAELLLRPFLRERRVRAGLAQLEGQPSPATLAASLGDSHPDLRERAAQGLAKLPLAQALQELKQGALALEEPLREAAFLGLRLLGQRPEGGGEVLRLLGSLARGTDIPVACAAARSLPALDPLLKECLVLADAQRHGRIRLALAQGILAEQGQALALELAGRLLAELLLDSTLDTTIREQALETCDPASSTEGSHLQTLVAARVAQGLLDTTPNPEVLWLLAEEGGPSEALLAARWIESSEYPLANAALEAVTGILARHEDLQGQGAAIGASLSRGLKALREQHPEGANRLADRLVVRLEELLRGLQA